MAGLKRITGLVEITYGADEPRTFDELVSSSADQIRWALDGNGGHLAQFAVTSTAVDPDPEPVAEDVPVVKPPAGQVD